MTHYDVLGVRPDASTKEVRTAFIRLARDHHPDFHIDSTSAARRRAEVEMRAINAAWAVLGDPSSRRDYDRSLHAGRARSTVDRDETARRDGLRRTASGASAHFRPLEPDDGDDIDPLLLDDTPYPGARPAPRWMQIAPVALVMGGIGLTIVGLVVSLRELLGLGVVTLALGAVAFLLAPFYVIARGRDAGGGSS